MPYTIETRAQGVVILTSSADLGTTLTEEFRRLSLEPLLFVWDGAKDPVELATELADYCRSHDLDYLVVVLSAPLSRWLVNSGSTFWQDLLTVGKGGNLVLVEKSWDQIPEPLPLPENCRRVLLGEYLDRAGEGAPTLDELLGEATTLGTISLPGDGIIDYSLLPLTDLALSLVHVATAPVTLSAPLILANPETISLLNLAHTISAALKKPVKIGFHGSLRLPTEPYNWEKILLTHAKYGIVISGKLDQELPSYLDLPPDLPTPHLATPAPHLTPLTPPVAPVLPSKHQPKPNLVFIPLSSGPKPKLALPRFAASAHPLQKIIFRGLALAFALYLGTLTFAATLVTLHLRSLGSLFDSGAYSDLQLSPVTQLAGLYLDANTVALARLPLIRTWSPAQDAVLLMDLYTQGLAVLVTTKELAASAKLISAYVLTDQGGDIASHFSSARLYSEELYERLSLLDGSMPSNPPALISRYSDPYLKLKSTLSSLKKNLITGKALLAAGPDLIALGGKAKYAVLLQNNMELRATGGFIGSFAIISLENGRLYDLAVYDVYSADGQLKGHVEPPAPIKDVLGEANWYLRDSNFDPDFPTSARRAEWFIKKTMNIDVDGTLAITLDLLKSLLKATGPLELPDYDETVDSGNIYERAQFHAEVNFFPGSSAKKEFLSSVADALFAKIQNGEGIDTLKLVSAMSGAVDSKNLLISVLDPAVEHVFSTLSWNGHLVDQPCPGGDTCIKDYLYLVDSNFGVNKANYYLSRNLDLTVNVGKEGTLSHVFKASYHNSATSTAWPAGPYKNYVRLYLPFGSHLESLELGGQPLTAQDYSLTEEHGKFVISFLMTVPVNSTLTLSATYTSPAAIRPDSLYTWFWQKQPGTLVSEPLSVTLNYPLYLKPAVVSPEGGLTPQQLRFDFRNDSDHRVTVKFSD